MGVLGAFALAKEVWFQHHERSVSFISFSGRTLHDFKGLWDTDLHVVNCCLQGQQGSDGPLPSCIQKRM